MQLDLKDRKILYELDTDSRQAYKTIAKKVGLSKDAVKYRINNMQATGLVKQFHTVIDTGKLGFISFRLFLKLQNTTPEKEAEIIEFLKAQKAVTWLVSIEGEYDIGMWILVKDITEVNKLWKDLLANYMNFIEKRWLCVFTRVSYFPRAYLLHKEKNTEEYVFITEPQDAGIDEKDMKLLRILAPNARVSILELSGKLHMTPKTVAARIKKLEKKGVIVGYRTAFDLEMLGYQHFKLHINLQNITEEKVCQFRAYVKQHPNIIYDNEVLGGDDFEIEIQVSGMEEFRGVINDIKARFAGIIKNYRYMIFYREHKFLFLPV